MRVPASIRKPLGLGKIMQLMGRVVRQAKRLPVFEMTALGTWLLTLCATEIAGRRSPNDLADAAALVVLLGLTTATAVAHRWQRLKTVSAILRLGRRAAVALARLNIEFGVDLRRTPPIRRAFPPPWRWFFVALVGLTIGLGFGSQWFPEVARQYLAPRFYLAYVTVLGGVWAAALAALATLTFLSWARIHDWFVESFEGQGKRPLRPELLTTAAVAAFTTGSAAFFPAWLPLVLCGLFFGLLTLAVLASGSGLTILWKSRLRGPIRSFDGRWLLWMQWAVPLLFCIDLQLLTRGELLWGASPLATSSRLPLTLLLGNVLAWTTVSALGLAMAESIRLALRGDFFNSLGQVKPVAVVDENLAQPNRRAEIRCRRQIVSGLERLFKRAARRMRYTGTGLWVGLQHWFILGLAADNDGDAPSDRDATILDGIVGAPFHRVIAREARRHYAQITQALQVDLILVENGIPFRRFVRVLRILFEIYDMHGGGQRAEELHFSGLPGIRVLIHDFDLGRSMTQSQTGYPEPDYDQIGRARILHVFKDRGECEAFDPVPESSEGIPVFSGA